MVAVENKKNYHSARVTKSRHDEGDLQIQFVLEPIKLGEDTSGNSISSCFVRPIGRNDDRPRNPLNQHAKVALQFLIDHSKRSSPNYPAGIPMTDWRGAVYGQLNCQASSKRKLFDRAKTALLEHNFIVIENDIVALAESRSAPGTNGTCPALVPSRPEDIKRSSGTDQDTPL
jgi:hypothetical protein